MVILISIKRNSKGLETKATGLRRESSKYKPNQTDVFKISRSKFTDFLTCQRCFYLDRVIGIISPSTPGWTLNETTDLLLKKEFDICREQEIPHRIFEKFGIANIVPYHHGLKYQFKDTNILLQGGVDDVWFDKVKEELIVVDYKSQANNRPVVTWEYLSGTYHQGYKIQLDFYAYLLLGMGFPVAPIGYFYVCNADRGAPGFNGNMRFEETLVPYEWDISWIESSVWEMIAVLNSTDIPSPNPSCENCAYAQQRAIAEI